MFVFKWYMRLIASVCGWQVCQVGCEWVCLRSARIYAIIKASTGGWWRHWLTHDWGARSILPKKLTQIWCQWQPWFWHWCYIHCEFVPTWWHYTPLKSWRSSVNEILERFIQHCGILTNFVTSYNNRNEQWSEMHSGEDVNISILELHDTWIYECLIKRNHMIS